MELIVVIAILGILAGVAVPAYTGYIKRANDAAVITQLDGIKTAAEAANATNANSISKISVTSAGVVTVTVTDMSNTYYSDFALFYGNGATATDNASATLSSSSWKVTDTSYSSGANWTPTDGWKAGT